MASKPYPKHPAHTARNKQPVIRCQTFGCNWVGQPPGGKAEWADCPRCKRALVRHFPQFL